MTEKVAEYDKLHAKTMQGHGRHYDKRRNGIDCTILDPTIIMEIISVLSDLDSILEREWERERVQCDRDLESWTRTGTHSSS